MAASLIASLLAGLLPAWRASRPDGSTPFLASRSIPHERVRGILIGAEVALPLIRGRLPARGETDVAVINQAMVRRFSPDRDPLGQEIETPRIERVRTTQGPGAHARVPEEIGIQQPAPPQE